MAKANKKKATVVPVVSTTNNQLATVAKVSASNPLVKTLAERIAAFDSLEDKSGLHVRANVRANLVGVYRAKDGKGTTTDRKLAKLNINGHPISATVPTRMVTLADGTRTTEAECDEVKQLRGRYRAGWGQAVIARLRLLGANASQAARDAAINQDGTPAAWRIRYNKDGSPAMQSARHLAVIAEFLAIQ